jgi:hypothetical protein
MQRLILKGDTENIKKTIFACGAVIHGSTAINLKIFSDMLEACAMYLTYHMGTKCSSDGLTMAQLVNTTFFRYIRCIHVPVERMGRLHSLDTT